MTVPRNVVWFQVLLYLSLTLDALSVAFQDRTPSDGMTEQMIDVATVMDAVLILLLVFLVWLAAQKRKSWPRFALGAMLVLAVISVVQVVGANGHVYAFLSEEQLANCAPSEVAGTKALQSDPSYANVSILSAAAEKFRVPQSLDVIWTAQNYHDLHDSFMGPANVAAVNRAFFKALKPGGIYLVVDHIAESGSGLRDTESLHRIDPIRLQKEIEAAGFILDAQSDVLRNPLDDHKLPVFDSRVRGQTDQVVYRFRKP